ncbi:MAG: hypothetical protein AB7N70_34930 [Dehalococcoidia bacterium]
MTDVILRLYQAVPTNSSWIDALLVQSAPAAETVAALGLPRLLEYYPAEMLARAELAIVADVPFPPVIDLGLPAFEAMATMPLAGITFRNRFFVRAGQLSEGLCAHELVHVVQWRVLGTRDVLLTYGLGIVQHGYEASPLEAIAFAMQEAFEAGKTVPGAVEKISVHARAARDAALLLYREHGLALGA